MAKEEFVIPVSKVKTKDNKELIEDLKKEVSFDVNELETRGMRLSKDGQICVKFPKFVQLIATHDFETIMSRYSDQEVIISSDLLMDLANSPEEPTESKFSWLFIGLVLGVVFAAIIFLIVL